MIFVILGTQDKPFGRLLEAIEELSLNEEIIVQAGYTKYESSDMKIVDYLSMEEFEKTIEKADYIITHGGVGTIMNALKYKKKIIGCARLAKYHEHQNDHQVEILEAFDSLGYLLYCEDLSRLQYTIEKIKEFYPKPFESNNEHMVQLIERLIES